MHFVRSWEPVIMMKTKKANFCTQAATLAQSYTSPSSSKQFSGTFFEPSVYCLYQLTAGSLQWKRSLFYVQVGWKKMKHSNCLWRKLQLPEGTLPNMAATTGSNWVLLFMIYARLRLPWDLWLALWFCLWHVLYCYFLFCSWSDIGEQRGLFLMA